MQMVPFEDALARVIDVAAPVGVETVAFEDAPGRVLAQDLLARSNAPATDVSAMDGYGVRDADLAVLPAALPVIGESFAGSKPQSSFDGVGCIRIFTGAPVPAGIDRVVIQEYVERIGDVAHFNTESGPGRNIREAGSDFKAGDCLVAKGTCLTWRAITTAASADRAQVKVYKQPKVVILATGDELAAPGRAYKTPGYIPESVSFGVAAYAKALGAQIVRSQRIADNPAKLMASAKAAVEDADVIIVTGGASVGEKDYARSMFGEDALDYIFPKVAIKPGKPVWMARIKSQSARKIILGLPGNPGSALVTARLFLTPLLMGITGQNAHQACQFRSILCRHDLPSIGGRETFSRAFLDDGGQAVLFSSQDSSAQFSLARADVLVRRLAHSPSMTAGATIEVLDF